MTNQVNWNTIFDNMSLNEVSDFAHGVMSGRQFYRIAVDFCAECSPEVRRLLRSRGVSESRQLARKALRRRGVRV